LKPDWYGPAEVIIGRLAAQWRAVATRQLMIDGDDLAQELWVAALTAEQKRPGTWRNAIRWRFARITAKEVRRNRLANNHV